MAIDPKEPEELNTIITGWATVAQTTGMPTATPEALIELSNNMPLYEDQDKRQAIVVLPSLIGAWPKMFLMIEDAFHKAKETGSEEDADIDEIIRIQSQEIAAAIYTYVNSAVVHTLVTTTTTGTGVLNSTSTTTTVGAGTGQGLGKLA